MGVVVDGGRCLARPRGRILSVGRRSSWDVAWLRRPVLVYNLFMDRQRRNPIETWLVQRRRTSPFRVDGGEFQPDWRTCPPVMGNLKMGQGTGCTRLVSQSRRRRSWGEGRVVGRRCAAECRGLKSTCLVVPRGQRRLRLEHSSQRASTSRSEEQVHGSAVMMAEKTMKYKG